MRGTWGLAGIPDQPSAVSLRGQGRFLTADGKAPSGQRWSLFLIHGCGHLLWSGCQHLWPQVMPPPVLVIFKCYLTRTLKDLISWPEITSACSVTQDCCLSPWKQCKLSVVISRTVCLTQDIFCSGQS